MRYSYVPLSDNLKAASSDRYLRLSLGKYGSPTASEFSKVESGVESYPVVASCRRFLTRNGHLFWEITASRRKLNDVYKSNSRSVLYSAVRHLETQWESSEESGILEKPQPINLFHSVLCGSCGTVDSPKLPVAESVVVRDKVPIILLHGLLGSARNFQSWMKLVQQREVQIDSEEMKIKREVMRCTICIIFSAFPDHQ